MSIAKGIKGSERIKLLKWHRLVEFERVFTLYLAGQTTASHVARRAKLMLEAGLPRLR